MSNVPKETASFRRDEVYTVLVCPVVDLELLTERYSCEYNNLRGPNISGRDHHDLGAAHLEALDHVDRNLLSPRSR